MSVIWWLVCRAGCFVWKSYVTVLLRSWVQRLSSLEVKFFSSFSAVTQIKHLHDISADISNIFFC